MDVILGVYSVSIQLHVIRDEQEQKLPMKETVTSDAKAIKEHFSLIYTICKTVPLLILAQANFSPLNIDFVIR